MLSRSEGRFADLDAVERWNRAIAAIPARWLAKLKTDEARSGLVDFEALRGDLRYLRCGVTYIRSGAAAAGLDEFLIRRTGNPKESRSWRCRCAGALHLLNAAIHESHPRSHVPLAQHLEHLCLYLQKLQDLCDFIVIRVRASIDELERDQEGPR